MHSAISPRARRAIARRGLDPATLLGSGPRGRIVEADVLAAPAPRAAGAVNDATALAMRRMIARTTSESAATIPHFYLQSEVDCTQLVALRAALAPGMEREHGVKPSITDFIVRAMAIALREQPAANRVWRADAPHALAEPAIGLVVGLPEGLAIPVLEGLGSLRQAATARNSATMSVRSGVRPTARPCASSLSNLGASRIDAFTAVIPLGQSSILAVGRLAHRAVAVGDALACRQTMRLTLSVDHRIFDGVPASAYLGRITELLEQPAPLV